MGPLLKVLTLSLLGILPGLLQAGDAQADPLTRKVEQLSARHAAKVAEAEALNKEGRVQAGTQLLLDLVPAPKRDAAYCFWIGNLLFAMDRETSYALHHRAFELEPNHPGVAFEWALEEHRAGHHAVAASLYERVLTQQIDPRQALLADCYLRLGRPKEACAAWKRANHPNRHTSIDFAIHWVYGKPSPYQRRAELLAKGEWELLVMLDAAWDTDWWNRSVERELLNRDLARAHDALGEGPRWQELKAYADYLTLENREAETLRPFLARGPWILAGAPLPRSNRLAARLLEATLQARLAQAPDLLARFGEELQRRIQGKDADAEDALHLLAGLRLAGNKPIEDLDRLGWERFGDARFAQSLLAGRGEALTSGDPDLQRALAAFPEDAAIARMAAGCAFKEKRNLQASLERLIRAEFNGLASDPNRFSYALKAYFAALDEALKAPAPETPTARP
jgi:hypothetical protein